MQKVAARSLQHPDADGSKPIAASRFRLTPSDGGPIRRDVLQGQSSAQFIEGGERTAFQLY